MQRAGVLAAAADIAQARLRPTAARPNTLGRRGGGCYSRTMTGQPIAQILPRKKPRPQWIVPLVTALVFVAVIMVLYKPA